jgi:hypothetical protein
VQDTPLRSLCAEGDDDGVGWIVHAEPFQRSARVAAEVSFCDEPTAVHTLGDTQDTPHKPPVV